jgi:hypothetical protein
VDDADDGSTRRYRPSWAVIASVVCLAGVLALGALALDGANDRHESDAVEALLGVTLFGLVIAAGGAVALAVERFRSR